MKKLFTFSVFFLVILLMISQLNYTQSNELNKKNIKRISLMVGCNRGGGNRIKLKYAVSDARNISKVMEEMGGILPEDNMLLGDPSRVLFLQTFQRLKNRVNELSKNYKVEVIIYYSGHSDNEGILLGQERVYYKELKEVIGRLDADVRIAILDSCSSGAFTRIKGGKKRAAFLIDDAYNMTGYAVMTSSSSDEASQESENLRGSFFTHNLVAGLRGAADMSGDQKVTLSEAYQYAFNETLTQTTHTFSGPQHPNYNIEMSGTGDVVMTDLRKNKTLLVLNKEIFGKIFIHDIDDHLVLEFRKHAGKEISLGLDEGKHRITMIADNKTSEFFVNLKSGKKSFVFQTDFLHTDRIITRSRGGKTQNIQHKKKRKFNFFIEMNLSTLKTNNVKQTLFGANTGIVLDNNLILGFGGYGNLSVVKVPEGLDDNYTIGGYGGLIFGYEFFSNKKINLRLTTLWGAGVEIKAKKQDLFSWDYDPFLNEDAEPFFILEPELSTVINLNRNVKFKIGLGYRIVGETRSDIKGPALNGTIHFRF